MENPILRPIKNGWAAQGRGWAVHAPTKEEARRLFEEATRKHDEIMQRADPEPLDSA